MDSHIPQTFGDRVDTAVATSDFTSVVKYLVSNTNSCRSDPSMVMRLLNNLSRLTLTEQISQVFQALIQIGFQFDSIEYVEPLSQLIEKDNTLTQVTVLDHLIRNKVAIDTALIQRALSCCFNQISILPSTDGNYTELLSSIIKVTRSVLEDPSKYVTQDFVTFLITRLLASGQESEVERVLTDTRVPAPHDAWDIYIERCVRGKSYQKALGLVDQFRAKQISDTFDRLYNSVLGRWIQLHTRTQTASLLQIVDHLTEKGVRLTYYNQIEVLYQAYLNGDQAVFLGYLGRLELETNVVNFILNLVLDVPDIRTGLAIFNLVFTGQLKSITLDQVEVSKDHLKTLLKVQSLSLLEYQGRCSASEQALVKIEELQASASVAMGKQEKIDKAKLLKKQFLVDEEFERFKICEEIEIIENDEGLASSDKEGFVMIK